MSQRKQGITLTETLIAGSILAVAVVLTARLSLSINGNIRNLELLQRVAQETTNLKTAMAAWSSDEVTSESISNQRVPPALASEFDNARWHGTVDTVSEPVAAKRITIGMRAERGGLPIEFPTLTFWSLDNADKTPAVVAEENPP